MQPTGDIALIGLAVMGQNLILNMADHGYKVVAYNRTVEKVDDFLNEAAKGHANVVGAHSVEEMVGLLKRPRKIMLMVKAGTPLGRADLITAWRAGFCPAAAVSTCPRITSLI